MGPRSDPGQKGRETSRTVVLLTAIGLGCYLAWAILAWRNMLSRDEGAAALRAAGPWLAAFASWLAITAAHVARVKHWWHRSLLLCALFAGAATIAGVSEYFLGAGTPPALDVALGLASGAAAGALCVTWALVVSLARRGDGCFASVGALVAAPLVVVGEALPEPAGVITAAALPLASTLLSFTATRVAGVDRSTLLVFAPLSNEPPLPRHVAVGMVALGIVCASACARPLLAPGAPGGVPASVPALALALVGASAIAWDPLAARMCSMHMAPDESSSAEHRTTGAPAPSSPVRQQAKSGKGARSGFAHSAAGSWALPFAQLAAVILAVFPNCGTCAGPACFCAALAAALLGTTLWTRLPQALARMSSIRAFLVLHAALLAGALVGTVVVCILAGAAPTESVESCTWLSLFALVTALGTPALQRADVRDAWGLFGSQRGLPVGRFSTACHTIAASAALTAREAEVMALVARGRSGRFIQDKLAISKGTYETHVRNVYRKLGIHTNQELIDLLEQTIDAQSRAPEAR